MEETTQHQMVKEKKRSHLNPFSQWSIVIASLIFSFSAYMMLHLYGIVHWKIMLNGGTPLDSSKEYAFTLLGSLMWLRLIFAALAVIYAGLSYTHGLTLRSLITSFFAGLAIITLFIMM